jgi:hypothetical protein
VDDRCVRRAVRGALPSTARDTIDPYIEVKVVGWKEDTKRERTKSVSNNGIDPAWNAEFTFQSSTCCA